MDKPKRSYYLPAKLVEAMDRECERVGLVKERLVAAAILSFLEAGPEARQGMFVRLETFVQGPRRGRRST
ncbi:MAG: hypothetical protein JXA69_19275 [Phycisphaerae bacterium]|nr:hypothetical protein [Phycisphaerae bacterium]